VIEVDPELGLEDPVDGFEALRRRGLGLDSDFGMPAGALEERRWHVLGRQRMIDDAGFNRRFRHAVELRAGEILGDDQPAGVVDMRDTPGPVAAAT
jgi:hypothetical protein